MWVTYFLRVTYTFGHRLVAKLRGFGEHAESTNLHDAALIRNWHKVVSNDDVVWVLGDLTVSNGQIDRMLGIMQRLPGTKHLIAGNHDPCHSLHKDAHKFQRRYFEAFDSVQTFAKRKIAGHSILLSHFPYSSDHSETARYMEYRLRDEGNFLIHGHTHSSKKETSATELHVGVDAWELTPVPLKEVESFVVKFAR